MQSLDVDARTVAEQLDRRAAWRWSSVAVVAGIVLVLANDTIARLLARTIPRSAEVTSAGTFFPPFAEAVPTLLWRNGVVLLTLPLLTAIWERWIGPARASRTADLALGATVSIGTGIWFGWLATPHNAFPSNARIHWVDYLTWKSDNYFYAAGRVPHLLFYDNPPLWQGLNAAILVALSIAVARRVGHGNVASIVLALFVATAGNVLRFANSAEDVMINLALAMTAVLASLGHRRWLFGASLAVLMLGRPQFAILIPCAMAAELLPALRRRSRPHRQMLFDAAAIGVAALGVTALIQGFFTLIGDRYFLTNGNIVDVVELADVEARNIDGFTIFAFSGSYLLHFAWVLPVGLLGAGALACVTARRLDDRRATSVYFCASAIAVLLVLHEARPLLYFNIRYLTYLLPFLLVMAWSAAVALRLRSDEESEPRWPRWASSAVAVVSLVSTWTIPGGAVELRNRLSTRPEIELLDVRSELRNAAGGRTVYLDFPTSSSRNYVSWVLRKPVAEVVLISEQPLQPDGILLSPDDVEGLVADPGLSTERINVYLDP